MAQESVLIDQLEDEKRSLETALRHLQSSITELKKAIADGDDDDDRTFKHAVDENVVVVAKYRVRIARLDEEIIEFKKGVQHLEMEEVMVPVDEDVKEAERVRGEETSMETDEARPTATKPEGGGGGVYL